MQVAKSSLSLRSSAVNSLAARNDGASHHLCGGHSNIVKGRQSHALALTQAMVSRDLGAWTNQSPCDNQERQRSRFSLLRRIGVPRREAQVILALRR